MFKSTFVFLLLVCFLQTNFATPFKRQVSSTDIEEAVKKISSDIESKLKGLNQNALYIINNVQLIFLNTFKEGLVSLSAWFLDLVLRIELLTMADGFHCMFPMNAKLSLEHEYKAVALGVSKLLMNLNTMEKTDKLISNVTKTVFIKESQPRAMVLTTDELGRLEQRSSKEKWVRTFLHDWFEELDHHFENDAELASEYKKLKSEAAEFVQNQPTMHEPLIKLFDETSTQVTEIDILKFLGSKPIFRQAVVNKIVLKQSVKHFSMIYSSEHHRRFLMARALIQKAATGGSDSAINVLYHKALLQASQVQIDSDDDVISASFFDSMEKILETDPTLNAEIRVLMKIIETSTVYDLDMLHIDLSPL